MADFTKDMTAKAEPIRATASNERARELMGVAEKLTVVPDTGTIIPTDLQSKNDGTDDTIALNDFIRRDLYDNHFNWIPGVIAAYGSLPNPDSSGDAASDFEDIGGGIDRGGGDAKVGASGGYLSETALEYVDDITSAVSDWTGEAASSFRSNFLNTLQGVVDNQAKLAKVLGATAYANEGLLEIAQKDMLNIADDTIVALENELDDSGAEALAIIAAVATVAAGVATCFTGAGAAIAAGGLTMIAGLASGGASVAGSDEASGEDKFELSADTTDGVLDNMCDALAEVENKLREGEDELKRMIDKVIEDVDAGREQYEAPRPDTLLDAENPSEVLKPPIA